MAGSPRARVQEMLSPCLIICNNCNNCDCHSYANFTWQRQRPPWGPLCRWTLTQSRSPTPSQRGGGCNWSGAEKRDIKLRRWRGRWLRVRDHHSPRGPSGWLCPHQLVRLQDQLWRFWGRSQSAEQVLRVSLLLCTISILVWACSASYEKKPGGSPHLSPAFWCCSCSW